MTVATPIQPDVTTQSAAVYKAAIDAQTAALAQTANMYAPHEAATPDMTVLVDAGRFLASAVTLVTNAQQTTATITAPVTNPRIDRVVIDAVTGVISVVAGAEAASPSAPAIPSGKLPLCQIALATSTAAITNSLITDERAFMANFPALLAASNTWTADQTISTTDPQMILIETDAAADNKRWDLIASGEALSIRAVNDAVSVTTDVVTVQRTGTTVDSVTLGGTSVVLTGGQLAFPSVPVPSANVNTLDDYKEGSFTATLTGGVTGGTLTFKYVKIGKNVTISTPDTSWSEISNATYKRITGLPSELIPGASVSHVCFASDNGGASVAARAVIAASGVWDCYATADNGVWTASGNMLLNIPCFSYSI